MDVAVGARGVGLAGRRVDVAVAGRLVAAGGAGVNAGVDVAVGGDVPVAASAAVGDGRVSSVGVALGVAEADNLGVLVGVGVTAGGPATEESMGQAQPRVINAATIAGTSTFLVSLVKGDVSFLGCCCLAGG